MPRVEADVVTRGTRLMREFLLMVARKPPPSLRWRLWALDFARDQIGEIFFAGDLETLEVDVL